MKLRMVNLPRKIFVLTTSGTSWDEMDEIPLKLVEIDDGEYALCWRSRSGAVDWLTASDDVADVLELDLVDLTNMMQKHEIDGVVFNLLPSEKEIPKEKIVNELR